MFIGAKDSKVNFKEAVNVFFRYRLVQDSLLLLDIETIKKRQSIVIFQFNRDANIGMKIINLLQEMINMEKQNFSLRKNLE